MERLCGITPENITELQPNEIFVFGSNLAGIHGAGAARTALSWGAKMGNGDGFSGNTYALPTKDRNIRTLPISEIECWVKALLMAINCKPTFNFLITQIGCGYAGYTNADIAPLFKEFITLTNCSLPIEFINHILKNK